MASTIGILLFDDVEELDFAGPWEVFASTTQQLFPDDRVVTIAQELRPIRCAKGLRVLPDCDFASAPTLDVVLVPGGQGTRREVSNPVLIEWLREAGAALPVGDERLHGRAAAPRSGLREADVA